VQPGRTLDTRDVASTDDAFERAYSQYLPAVSGYLYRRVERRFVEDLAADVFAIAWRRRDSVAAGEELPWLYRIAGNVVANHRRKQTTGIAVFVALRPADSAPSAEDIVIADVSLAEAWRGLRPRDREVLALALVEDLAVADIAITLAISLNATSIRLHRAKRKLADLLRAQAAVDAPPDDSSSISERSGAVETSPRYEQPS
jgi:RNA polymerase sigma-70 factor (ECF subfamily)